MLAKFSVKKPLTVLVAVILVLILGFVSFTSMTPDLLPNMYFPMKIDSVCRADSSGNCR